MNKFISIILVTFLTITAFSVQAEYSIPRYYPKGVDVPTISPDNKDYVIPAGNDHTLLPEVLPCVSSNYGIRCNYLMYPTNITLPSTVPGEFVSVPNETMYICRMGGCRSEYGDSGAFPEDVNAKVNIWYRLQQSSDGALIAVRRDVQGVYSSAYAGASLYFWFLQAGVSQKTAQAAMEYMYVGGWNKYLADFEAMCADVNHDGSYCGD